jgi:hypothetical protein
VNGLQKLLNLEIPLTYNAFLNLKITRKYDIEDLIIMGKGFQ